MMNTDEVVSKLRDMATYDCGYEEQSDTAILAAELIKSLQAQLDEALKDYDILDAANTALHGALEESQRRERDARNELCYKCGRYREAHMGACDGCRWKEIANEN